MCHYLSPIPHARGSVDSVKIFQICVPIDEDELQRVVSSRPLRMLRPPQDQNIRRGKKVNPNNHDDREYTWGLEIHHKFHREET